MPRAEMRGSRMQACLAPFLTQNITVVKLDGETDPRGICPTNRASPPTRAPTRATHRAGNQRPKSKSGVSPTLRIDDLLQTAEHLHGRKYLRQARIRLALRLDGGDEFAILELNAVHRHVDLRQVDRVLLPVDQIVVIGVVRAVVADVAEERTDRPVIVERQRTIADRAG